MIDTASTVLDPNPFQWGPIIVAILSAALTGGGVLGWWIFRTITQHTTALAVLVSETRPSLKLVNEVIDHKAALSELNEKVKVLWQDREDEITLNREEVSKLRERA